MPGIKSKKASKRQTLHQRHKVLKKIAEHHKKLKKEARKNPNKRSKLKKDPGIPNLWPFKEQLMDQISQDKERAEEEKRLQKLAKREQLAEIRRRAEAAEGDYEERQHSINEEARYLDSSRKSFFREFKKVVKASDVVIEVLDARDPLGTRCIEIERQILAQDPNKKIILVLNKIDLISRQNLVDWLKVLRNEFPTIAFKSSIQQQRQNIGQHSLKKATDVDGITDCLGASTLIGLLKNYARSKDMKLAITVGIIGIPNVGKSSLINSLKRARAVGVGSTPGFTRSMQEVVLDKNIKLLDCPGIVFTSATTEAEAVLRNAVKIEQLVDVIAPVELILSKCSKEQMMEIYLIAEFDGVVDFLTQVAKKRGKVKSGGVVDIDSAAKVVIQDWNGGKIPYMSRPPKDISQISAEIVPSWSAEFNIAAIEAMEAEHVIQQVPDKPSVQFVTIQPSASLKADVMFTKMDQDEDEDESMEDDDDEEDEEDEEDGEEDEDMEGDEMEQDEPVQTKKSVPRPKQVDESDRINPKLNKNLKEEAKKKSKAERKRKRNERSKNPDHPESSESESDDTYNFGTDFWARAPASQILNDGKASSSNATEDFNEFSM